MSPGASDRILKAEDVPAQPEVYDHGDIHHQSHKCRFVIPRSRDVDEHERPPYHRRVSDISFIK